MCHRILDNLPLVVPAQRVNQDSTIIYQLGFFVGLKLSFSGVTDDTLELLCSNVSNRLQFCWTLIWAQLLLQSKDYKYFINNHLSFTVKYHKDEEMDLARIVGFEVKPFRYIIILLPSGCQFTALRIFICTDIFLHFNHLPLFMGYGNLCVWYF